MVLNQGILLHNQGVLVEALHELVVDPQVVMAHRQITPHFLIQDLVTMVVQCTLKDQVVEVALEV